MFTRLLQLAGARVLATDLLPSRLRLARKFGAKRAVLASQLSTLNPQLDAAVHQALQLVRGGGQVLLFAHTKRTEVRSPKSKVQSPKSQNQFSFSPQPSAFSLDLASICLDEKDLIGSYSSDFTLQAEVTRLVFSRRLDVRSLITHHFTLDQTASAVALAAHPKPDSLKIMVQAGGD